MIERKIVTGFITSNEFIERVKPIFQQEYLEAKMAKQLAKWCIEYYDKYGKAPYQDIQTIFEQKIQQNNMDKDTMEDIEDVLHDLNKDFTKNNGIDINILIQQTEKHFQEQQAKDVIKQQDRALEKGELDKFYKLQSGFEPLQLPENKNTESYNAKDILTMETKQVEWLIKDMLPKGLTVFGGRSKAGKSFFMLYAMMKLAQNKPMFEADFTGESGDILYICLEDPLNRLQQRMKSIELNPNYEKLSTLEIKLQWDKLQRNGLKDIENWIQEKDNPKLICVDTIARIWSKNSKTTGGGLYAEEYSIFSPLADLAHKYNISIVVNTHTTKNKASDVFDEILGSMGVQGPADNLVVLSNMEDGNKKLSIRGKDVVEQHRIFEIAFDVGLIHYIGESDNIQQSEGRQDIIDLLKEAGEPLPFQKIKAGLKEMESNISQNSVKTTLMRMKKEAILIQPKYGKYAVPGYENKKSNYKIGKNTHRQKSN